MQSEHELMMGEPLYPEDRQVSLMDIGTQVFSRVNPIVAALGWAERFVGTDWVNSTSATNMTGVHTNNNSDLAATLQAVRFTGFMVVFCLGAFWLLLRRLPAVYAHRALEDFANEAPEGHVLDMPAPGNPIGWIWTSSAVEDEEVMKRVGLDALMFIKFFQLCRKVLLVICPTIIVILVPLHWTIGSQLMKNANTGKIEKLDSFSRIGISSLTSTWDIYSSNATVVADMELDNRILCWAHAAMVWFVCAVTVRLIESFHEEFLELRWMWLKARQPPEATTLLVEGIPAQHRSDESLYTYFAKLFSEKAIHRAYVIRRTWTLRRNIAIVARLEAKLKSAREAWEASGHDESTYFDLGSFVTGHRGEAAINALTTQLEEAQEAVKQERVRVEEATKARDPSAVSTSGFITFTSRRWCRLASREQLKANPEAMKLSPPPSPDDVRYDDLATDPAAQTGSQLMEIMLTCCVFIFWVPLTAFLSTFTRLEDLKHYQALAFLNELPEGVQSILEGVLAQLSLKIVLAILPMILMSIINTNFLKSGNEAQLRMQSRYFMFLVVFVVLVSALSQTLLHTLKELVANPTQITLLLSKLPDSSHFYINYLVLGMFTIAMAMIRISPMCKYLLFKTEAATAAETRKSSEPEDQDGDGMGARMAKVSHIMTITLVFCHCSPSITVASLAWFCLAGCVYRWLVLFAETKKPDLGGAFYDMAIKHLYYSLGMYVCLMFVLLMNAPWGPGLPSAAVLICGVVLYNSYGYHCAVNWQTMPFETVVANEEAKQQRGSVASIQQIQEAGKYVQEEIVESKEEAKTTSAEKDAASGKRSDGSSA